MKPIYKPKGLAGEYCALAVNIYTGCNHGCTYCYARKSAERFGKDFDHVESRPGIVDAVRDQFRREKIKDQEIFLCFTCDPYPRDVDTTATREVIQAIKESGNHVRILTKGASRAMRDFDLLDLNDWFGGTFSSANPEKEPFAAVQPDRLATLYEAHMAGINTWVSCEPVFDPEGIFSLIKKGFYIDHFKIGKLNHQKSEINWKEFGLQAESLCKQFGRKYTIKADLRAEMEKA